MCNGEGIIGAVTKNTAERMDMREYTWIVDDGQEKHLIVADKWTLAQTLMFERCGERIASFSTWKWFKRFDSGLPSIVRENIKSE